MINNKENNLVKLMQLNVIIYLQKKFNIFKKLYIINIL